MIQTRFVLKFLGLRIESPQKKLCNEEREGTGGFEKNWMDQFLCPQERGGDRARAIKILGFPHSDNYELIETQRKKV